MCKKIRVKTLFIGVLLSCLVTLTPFSVYAEDTEIYKNLVSSSNSNVMFILDLSGSMKHNVADNVVAEDDSSSRLNIMKAALLSVLNDPDIKHINMGLMGFSGSSYSSANGLTLPVSNVEAPADLILALNPTFDPAVHDSTMTTSVFTKKNELKTKFPWLSGKKDKWLAKAFSESLTKTLTRKHPKKATTEEINTKEYMQVASSTWGAIGGTPIVDSLYEATLYFKGESVDYGKYLATDIRSAHPSSYEGALTLESLVPELVCLTEYCYDNECDAGTKQCEDYNAGTSTAYCYDDSLIECQTNNPSWTDCIYKEDQSCSTSCPENKYDEFNQCLTPQVDCVPHNYFICQSPYAAGTDCTHQVCSMVDKTVVTGAPKYISPIKNECQNSRYILLSDGEPTVNTSASRVDSIIPSGYSNNCQDEGDTAVGGVEYYGRCGANLVKYLHDEDQSDLAGKQTIETSTIGFALNDNPEASGYLKLLANNGGGEFYTANDLDSLTKSFKEALLGATKKARLFTTPSFAIDPSRLLEHNNDVYLPVFSYNNKPRWSGNLKKFKLLNHIISDKNNAAATDAKGTLRPDAQDEWAAVVPDHAIKGGGAASLLDPVNRNLLTDTAASTLQVLNKSNVSKTLLGDAAMEDDYQDALLSFIQGYEKDGSSRKHMGDIIHSKPVVVSYGATKRRIYVGTNEGFLHSFDRNGIEKFAFMPKDLLKNIDIQYRNESLDEHPSGVDGEITTWVSDDVVKNGTWDNGEKIILFFGLRRGGKTYYALDVSDPDADPTLLWKIDPSMTGFSEIGQTWSTPVLTQLRYGGDPKLKPVLIFGGGYNTRIDEEDKNARSLAATSNAGTAVFIVDAMGNGDGTTNKLWQAEHFDMKYSIPGNIRALDMDRNGSVDRLYFGDMGGNLWRTDLNAGDFATTPSFHDLSKAIVTKVADLGGSGTDLRKFYYEPDVAFFRHGGRFLLTIAIGSGYRAHPLNENIVDRFYVLRDQYVLRTPDGNFNTITETSSQQPLQAPVDKTKNLLDNDYYGWYHNLTAINHEKVLASATTFMSRVSFTSFGKTAPTTVDEGSCEVATNFQSRAYVMDLLRGGAVIDFDTTQTGNEISMKVSDDEIVATPQIVFGKIKTSLGSKCTKDDCHQGITLHAGKQNKPFVDDMTAGGDVDISNLLPKVFWREKEK